MSPTRRRKLAALIRRNARAQLAIAAELDGTDVAATVRAHRAEAELTQAELAERVGVDEMTISRYERGMTRPSAEILARIEAVARGHMVTVGHEPLTTPSQQSGA